MMAGAIRNINPKISERGINQKLPFLNENLIDKISTPVPYSLEFELTIVSNYIDDAHQILEQILPYFAPYTVVTVNIPEIDLKFDMKVILEGVNQDQEFEMTEDDNRALS